MSDQPPRRLYLGVLPSGAETFVADGEIDPVARLIAEGNARLDRIAEEERQREAASASRAERTTARARGVKLARMAKRLKQAMTWRRA